MNIKDRSAALENLRRLGYYRLSGYWYPFQERSSGYDESHDAPAGSFVPGVWFEDIVAVCEFDRKLRNVILAGTEPFEMAIRVAVAQRIGSHNPFAHLDKAYWGEAATKFTNRNSDRTDFDYFVERQVELIRRSTEAFAKNFAATYEGPMPIWASIELWDFGMLTRFFEVMHESDREAVAEAFGLAGGRRFQGWLRAVNDLRNVCAHHSRLFKRHFPSNPGFPKDIASLRHLTDLDDQRKHRIYPLLCVLAFILDQLPECRSWRHDVIVLFETLASIPIATLDDFGFPEAWIDKDLWSGIQVTGR